MVVITGATGLLGSVLIDHFIDRNIPVTALHRGSGMVEKPGVKWVEADISDINHLTNIFEGARCVVHSAAMISFAQRNKQKIFNINVGGTTNVVNACLQSGVERLVHVSSVAALGTIANQRTIDESASWPGTERSSNYGQSKYLAELEVFRGEAEGLSAAVVNPSVILANGNHHRSTGKIFQYLKDERPFYTDGHLNYVDARDVAEMIFRLFENRSLRGRYIANAGTVDWKSLFEKIANRLNKKPPYIKVSSRLTQLAALADWIRSTILGKEPLITKETANMARQYISYSNEKATSELAMTFRNLDSTLDWCCNGILKKGEV